MRGIFGRIAAAEEKDGAHEYTFSKVRSCSRDEGVAKWMSISLRSSL